MFLGLMMFPLSFEPDIKISCVVLVTVVTYTQIGIVKISSWYLDLTISSLPYVEVVNNISVKSTTILEEN